MTHTSVQAGALAVLTILAVACGSGAQLSSSGSQPPPSAAPATFNNYDADICGAFTSLIRAYGNPDTSSQSAMRKALDDAVAAGDLAGAERATTAMLNELEAGRRFAASAARWRPGATTAAGPAGRETRARSRPGGTSDDR